jgi:hypothetical protein
VHVKQSIAIDKLERDLDMTEIRVKLDNLATVISQSTLGKEIVSPKPCTVDPEAISNVHPVRIPVLPELKQEPSSIKLISEQIDRLTDTLLCFLESFHELMNVNLTTMEAKLENMFLTQTSMVTNLVEKSIIPHLLGNVKQSKPLAAHQHTSLDGVAGTSSTVVVSTVVGKSAGGELQLLSAHLDPVQTTKAKPGTAPTKGSDRPVKASSTEKTVLEPDVNNNQLKTKISTKFPSNEAGPGGPYHDKHDKDEAGPGSLAKPSTIKLTPEEMAHLNLRNPTTTASGKHGSLNLCLTKTGVPSSCGSGTRKLSRIHHTSPTQSKTLVLPSVSACRKKTLLIGDSQVRHLKLPSSLGYESRTWCVPGARTEQISTFIPEILNSESNVAHIVLCIGTNNIGLDTQSGVATRLTQILKIVKSLQPQAHISVVGLFPQYTSRVAWLDLKQYLVGCNSRIMAVCKESGVGFISMWDAIMSCRELMSSDGVHLSARGKDYLTDAILQSLMQQPNTSGSSPVQGN